MKTLYLVRHAKSSWEYPYLDDFDRPLNERGKHAAPKMGQWLRDNNYLPDYALSSPALRAKTTAEIILSTFQQPQIQLCFAPLLYMFTTHVEEVLPELKHLPSDANKAMLFGHNPTFSALAHALARAPLPFDELPTCGFVALQFDIADWQSLHFKQAELLAYQFPKKLPTS